MAVILIALFAAACARSVEAPRPRNLLLVTIDTLRADRVGAYGYSRARTPRLDALAAAGTLFERAYAAAPITLPSHATILSGRYPPGHGARDNGMKVSEKTPMLATELKARGYRTGAFVAAFPLDHQFGLARGFDVYSDRLPRDQAGRQVNERPGSEVVTEAIAWLGTQHPAPGTPQHPAPDTLQQHPAPSTLQQHPAPSTLHPAPFFLWIHLFEPHAPYEGDLSRPVAERYDNEVATVDREIGRLLDAVGALRDETLIVATADHGEAFGEHGEYAHSIFVYDTTLHVPLVVSGPEVSARRVTDAVTLADIAPTVMKRLGFEMRDVDGVDLSSMMRGEPAGPRELYAESFAPLTEFGWAPLRSVRSGEWKFIAAPKPELYEVSRDAAEQQNVFSTRADVARALDTRVARYSDASLGPNVIAMGEAAERLRALGYAAGSTPSTIGNQSAIGNESAIRHPQSAMSRADPKDKRALAARLAQVTSGELQGHALVDALEGIVREDPRNGQAHLRLAYARVASADCARAEPEFHAAIANGLPSPDAYLGLAGCLGARRDFGGAERALNEALRLEPDNPVIVANIGILKGSRGDTAGAIQALSAALATEPNLHEARFNLALTYARAGRKAEAVAAAQELLRRLPADAPQRPEIERFLKVMAPQ